MSESVETDDGRHNLRTVHSGPFYSPPLGCHRAGRATPLGIPPESIGVAASSPGPVEGTEVAEVAPIVRKRMSQFSNMNPELQQGLGSCVDNMIKARKLQSGHKVLTRSGCGCVMRHAIRCRISVVCMTASSVMMGM